MWEDFSKKSGLKIVITGATKKKPGEKPEFLKWNKQLSIVAETSLDKKYFNAAKDESELCMFFDASEDTMCIVAAFPSEAKRSRVIIFNSKMRSGTSKENSIPRLELRAALMAVKLKEQIIEEHKISIHICSSWSDSTTALQWIYSSHRKQQVFVHNQVADIKDTNNFW